jgi:hypothetical protein
MTKWQVNDDEQMSTTIHALSRIWTHGLSIQAIEAYTSDRTTTGTRENESDKIPSEVH